MAVTYEWVAEPVDQHDDIIDPIFGDTFKEVEHVTADSYFDAVMVNFALVRNVGNEDDGLQERQYAYLTDGTLPDEFDGGAKIPKRFHS